MKNLFAQKQKNIFLSIALGVVVFSCIPYVLARAAEDQFIIRQIIGGDITPPSVPTDVTATAISQTQIDLSWTASTDNSLIIAGYQVFRDSVFLATTTATTYSSIDLTPNTLYTYNITAFDNSDNISAQSASVSTTTFAVPTPTTTPITRRNVMTSGSEEGVTLTYLSVTPDTNSASILFGANVPVRAFVYWGQTLDYEMGSIASPVYLRDRVFQISGLSPATQYFYKIEIIDAYGRRFVLDNQTFTTLGLRGVVLPQNVSDFVAIPSQKDITLTWKNPNTEFDVIRIVKSDKFYPRDPFDGEVVYEGRAEKYIDKKVVADTAYYYSAFTRNIDGNYSSGAVTDGSLLKPGQTYPGPHLFAGILELSKDGIDPLLQKLSVADIQFMQDGKILVAHDGVVEIQGDRSFVISVDYEKLPEILKTIVVTLYDSKDQTKTFSFLLRVNENKTAYTAHIAAFGQSGTYKYSFRILDHKRQGLISFVGTIISNMPDFIPGNSVNLFDKINSQPLQTLGLTTALLLLVLTMVKMLQDRLRIVSGVIYGKGSILSKQ